MKGFLIKTLAFLPLSLLLFLGNSRQVFAQDIFWSTPAKISQSSNYALQPVVTTDNNGYVHAVWMETEGENGWWNPPSLPSPGIWHSFWNGDTWSTPDQVNSPALGLAELPSVAVTPDNNLHAVWDEYPAGSPIWNTQIYYSRYNGSSWTSPVSISAPIHSNSHEWAPKIAADSAGNLHVLFSYTPPLGNTAGVYYTKWNGAGWSTPVEISQGLDSQFPDLAVDSSGNTHVLLWDTRPLATGGIYYTFYNGSIWSGVQQLKTGEAMFPRLVVDGANNLHAAWLAYDYAGGAITVEYARKPSGSNWSSPFVVSTTVAEPYWWVPLIGLTVDSSNNAYVGWGQYNSTWYDDIGYYGVDAMYRKYTPSTNQWSNPNIVRSTKYLDAPAIWRDKWWNQHFVWSEMNPSTNQWQFWYSEVPANSAQYNPSTALTITMDVTSDTIKIPTNALSSAATISAQVGPVPASADPLVTTIPRSYTFRPHGYQFINGKVATATINYLDAEVLGADESQLKVYIWDATLNAGLGGWSTSYTTSVNTGPNRITVDLPHFSLYGIMAPKVKVGWLPPISNVELYTMTDGSTLPVKFSLAHYDGTPLHPPQLPEDAVVVIKDSQGEEKRRYLFGEGSENLRYDASTGQYLANVKTKELNLGAGEFTSQVYIFGQPEPTSAISFKITEPGKVKGAAAP